MKNTISLTIVFFALLVGFIACKSAPFAPEATPNPWPDNYEAVSGMTDYKSWGTYNVHDPAVRKVGDTYYMYSTDAIYHENRREAQEKDIPLGFIQIRKSKDLVNWEFVGWALPSIPEEAVEWVRSRNNGRGAYNIWAPYMVATENGRYRLYYCVSAFGKNTSYMGLAESISPEGPWELKGAVVKTDRNTPMNAIDPSVIDAGNKMYMHYGSYFGGLYCVELDKATGLPAFEGDKGRIVARRANYIRDNIEAPEIIKNPANGLYYLFTSYDPLMTTYNVRVCRSDKPEGPFTDFHGKVMADTTENFPIITAPYCFDGHDGWVGTAHCGVFDDGDGNFFMAHQGRLATNPGMMDLHLRQMFFTPEGWPVVSPERYAGTPARHFSEGELEGEWEIIRIREPRADGIGDRSTLWADSDFLDGDGNRSTTVRLASGGKIAEGIGRWTFDEDKQTTKFILGSEEINDIVTFAGHDWEREQTTVLMSGLDKDGRAFWAKKVK